MVETSIVVKAINKSYGAVKALDTVSFEVSKGELFGLIGPDGAGKTTLFRILATLLLPDAGSATLGGYDVVKDYIKLRHLLGYMPGRFSLYQDLTVEENLRFFAGIFKTTPEKNYHLIRDIFIQLEPFRKRKAGKLSGGMKQKLALSCALIHKPEILILDEPTTGVDAVSRREFWEMLSRLRHEGITIIVSTPYMDEARRCDRVALIQEGRILKIESPKGIIEQFGKKLWQIQSADFQKLKTDLRNFPGTDTVFPFGRYLHVTFTASAIHEKEILNYLTEKGHSNPEITSIEPSIEDCFMELMGKSSPIAGNYADIQPDKPHGEDH